MAKKSRLGRGLDSLFPGSPINQIGSSNDNLDNLDESKILQINVNEIKKNPYQPREEFDKEALQELADSIKEKGVLQPILVRKKESGFELVAGERRLEASKLAGIRYIPAIITNIDSDEDLLEFALIENIQRENLNPIEEAKAYKRLNKEFGLSHEEVAKKVGKNRATVTNLLRLLNLPEKIQNMIETEQISTGHAKILLGIENPAEQMRLAYKIVNEKLSVRALEAEVQKVKDKKSIKVDKSEKVSDPFLENLQENLIHYLRTKVSIQGDSNKGKIIIEYLSLDDLNRLISLITSEEIK